MLSLVEIVAWRQTIIWTNADLFVSEPFGTHFYEIKIKIQKKKIFQGNESLNGNCKMSPILFGPWYVAWCLGISWTIFHRSSNSMEIVLCVTKLQSVIQLKHFAHTITGRLSCHVQNFVAITSLQLIWENEISIEFELRLKHRSWNGPLVRGYHVWTFACSSICLRYWNDKKSKYWSVAIFCDIQSVNFISTFQPARNPKH